MTDPFEELAMPAEPQQPRPRFARALRRRLVAALAEGGPDDDALTTDVPTIDLPWRKPMSAPTLAPAATLIATPYLCVDDGAGAIDWYVRAFGAVEQFRVAGPDGRVGHADLTVGTAHFMLSDEAPALGVLSPRTIGGTATTVHLEVADVDAIYARAVDAGATAQREPADQPHGARHGTLIDPFGHRWMLSQPIENVSLDEYASRSESSGFRVQRGPRSGERYIDGIWSSMTYTDPDAGIRFVTEVLGFEELVLVRDDAGAIVHTEYRWPEGGIIGIAAADATNPFLPPPGKNGVYVVTQNPHAVWERCQAAGVEVIRPPAEPHYDPGGMGFSVRDGEGNAWSFGTYAGGATS